MGSAGPCCAKTCGEACRRETRSAAPWGDVPLGDILWCGGGDRRRGVHPLPVGGGGPLRRGQKEWIIHL